MSNLYLHVGWPKTATKSIQRGVFKKLKLFKYKYIDRSDMSIHPYYGHKILRPFLYRVGNENYKIREILKEKIFCHSGSKEKIFYSDEVFLAILVNSNIKKKYNLDLISIIKRIKEFLPNANLVFTIRNQMDFVRSWYSQNFGMRKVYSREHFIHYIESSLEGKGQLNIDMLNYYKVIKTFQHYFPKSKVKVLLYEDFAYNFDNFLDQVVTFLGTPKKYKYKFKKLKLNTSIDRRKKYLFNRSYTKFRSFFLPNISFSDFFKLKNKLVSFDDGTTAINGPIERICLYIDRRMNIRVKQIDLNIPEKYRLKIYDKFLISNKKLNNEFKLNMKKYNYF